MADISSLQLKVNALKAIVEQNAISPLYLGSLLSDIIALLDDYNIPGLSENVRTAISAAASANAAAAAAIDTATAAADTASNAMTQAALAASLAQSAIDAVKPIIIDDISDALTAAGFPAITMGTPVITASEDEADPVATLSDDDDAPIEQTIDGVTYRDSNPSKW